MIPVSSYLRNLLDGLASTPAMNFIFKNYPVYAASALPDAASPKWSVVNTGASASVAGGKLSLSVPAMSAYVMATPNPANNNAESVIELKAQVSADGYLSITLDDGLVSQPIEIWGTYAGGAPGAIVNPITMQAYPIDPSSAAHTYKIIMQGNNGEVYFDGAPVMTPAAPGSAVNGINITAMAYGSTATVDIYPIYINADLSSSVKAYGQIQKRGDQVISGDITTGFDNSDKRFNDIIKSASDYFLKDTELRLYFVDPAAAPPPEFISLFNGKVSAARFSDNAVDIGLKDKFYWLQSKKIGTKDVPVDFVNVNPADLLWSILTTYGGLDNTASTANRDIDYTAWLAWQAYCSAISMAVSAQFTGQDIITILQTYISITNSAVYCESNGLIRVIFWSNTGVLPVFSIGDFNKLNIAVLDIDSTDLVNDYVVYYGYNTTTQAWSGQQVQTNAASIAIYGDINKELNDTSIWHYTSASALNIAQRMILDTAWPAQRVQITTLLSGFTLQVYDGITLTDAMLGLAGQAVRLEQIALDLDKLETTATGKFIAAGFTNYVKLDDASLGMLDANLLE